MAGTSISLPEYQSVRLNFVESLESRVSQANSSGFGGTVDIQYVNGYFDPVYNTVKRSLDYFFTRRSGLVRSVQPSGTSGVGRGIYTWGSFIYSVIGRKIYKSTSSGSIIDLGILMPSTDATSIVGFSESRPGATTQYLGINTGTALYLIQTDNSVTILNNVVISTNTLANPTVITTATAHNLTTGNKVYISGNITSVPSINGTVYVVTVTSPTTFTIPVNVTTAGTGGTLGTFPSPNTGDLLYMDGYWVTAKSDCTIWNCDLDNPLVWNPINFITAQMKDGHLVGLARQQNYIFALGDSWMQAFYNGDNPIGSFLTNAEAAMQQVGCSAKNTISHHENTIIWVSNTNLGGYTLWRLDGTSNLKDIGTSSTNRLLEYEQLGITQPSIRANLIRIMGKVFYILHLTQLVGKSLVYDLDLDMWYIWTDATNSTYFPMVSSTQYKNTLYIQHPTDGYISYMIGLTFTDNGVAFTMSARTKRFDGDSIKRKFCTSVDLIADKTLVTTSEANVTIQYSDDDYQSWSTARTYNTGTTRLFGKSWGSFRRRSWLISHAGDCNQRWVGLEMDYGIGDR